MALRSIHKAIEEGESDEDPAEATRATEEMMVFSEAVVGALVV